MQAMHGFEGWAPRHYELREPTKFSQGCKRCYLVSQGHLDHDVPFSLQDESGDCERV